MANGNSPPALRSARGAPALFLTGTAEGHGFMLPKQVVFPNLRWKSPMLQETAIYLVNIVIAVILATLLTHAWVVQGRRPQTGYWMLAAWVMALADVFFALRPDLPAWFGRLVPTLLVTVGQSALLIGAHALARKPLPVRLVTGLLLFHGAMLAYFYLGGPATPWRMFTNGAVWATLGFAAYAGLRSAPAVFWKPVFAPANVFLLHACFHVGRSLFALFSSANDWSRVSDALQVLGDLEASFFIVALFTALLIATLQQRHEELMSARAEVETLSGLLPICAWCKKVRDDAGYWQQVEHYFEQRDRIRFTHGICHDCMSEQLAKDPVPPSPGGS